MYIHMYIYMYTYVYIHMYIYIYIDIPLYIHMSCLTRHVEINDGCDPQGLGSTTILLAVRG